MVRDFFEDYVRSSEHLMNLTIEITSICNLKCSHCYVDDRHASSRFEYLDIGIIKKVVNEALDLQAVTITITGGEPLMHPDFLEIVSYIKDKGFVLFLKTNGTLITDNNITIIKKYVDQVILTRYGCSKKVYEQTTKVKGSYDRYVNALSLLQTNKIPYKENAVLLKDNEEELAELLESTSMLDAYITATCENPYATAHRPSDAALYEYYKRTLAKLTIGKYEGIGEERPVCNCCTCSLTINSNGTINPCTNFYYSLGESKRQALRDIWFSKGKQHIIESCKFKNFKKCISCPNKKYLLSLAPCNNYTETNDVNDISEEMCRHCFILKQVCEDMENVI